MRITRFRKEYGNRVQIADELYLRSGIRFPLPREYRGFPQLENGIGKIVKFRADFEKSIRITRIRPRRIAVLTSVLGRHAFPEVSAIISAAGCEISLHAVPSLFWGKDVTVTGLLTGSDYRQYIMQHRERLAEYERVFISGVSFNDDGLFLDDLDMADLQGILPGLRTCDDSGEAFAMALMED